MNPEACSAGAARTDDQALLVLCRSGFETILMAEIAARNRQGAGGEIVVDSPCPGMVRVLSGQPATTPVSARFPAAFVFERQRLTRPLAMPVTTLKPMALWLLRRYLADLTRTDGPWTLQVYPVSEEMPDGAGWSRRAAALQRILCEQFRQRFPPCFRRYRETAGTGAGPGDRIAADLTVLQVALGANGVWSSLDRGTDLSSVYPAGRGRMRADADAPSRSHLKIEEILARWPEAVPRPGDRVIDLGAAPGGWTHAFLKRGCRVLAIDRGPLKLVTPHLPEVLEHRRVDGMTFEPSGLWRPADWLLCDMLVPPAATIGLLRKWLTRRWMRRFAINLKLPQVQPWTVVAALDSLLAATPRVTYRIRQLYHDRREVSAWGMFV